MRQWATDKKVLIVWDTGDGPPLATDGTSAYHHFIVMRAGADNASTVIERTTALFCLDQDVRAGQVYQYVVYGADADETTLTEVDRFTATAAVVAPTDLWAPTAPVLRASGTATGIRWEWEPSVKPNASDIIGYTFHDADEAHPVHFLREVAGPTTVWVEKTAPAASRIYAMRGIDRYLNQSELSAAVAGQAGSDAIIGRCNLILNPRVHNVLVYDVANWYVRGGGSRVVWASPEIPAVADAAINITPAASIGVSAQTDLADIDETVQTFLSLLPALGTAQVGYLHFSWYSLSADTDWQTQIVIWNGSNRLTQQEWVETVADGAWHRQDIALPLYADFASLRVAFTPEVRGSRTIVSSATGNPTTISTFSDIALPIGKTYPVTIASHVGSTPSLNGTHTATVTDLRTFTIPVNVTAGGYNGTVNFGASPTPGSDAYFTAILADYSPNEAQLVPYADGDASGWEFLGDSHGSVSCIRSSRWNAVWNPSAGGTEYWDAPGLETVTEIEGGVIPLPANASSAFHAGASAGGTYLDYYDNASAQMPAPPGIAPGDTVAWQMQVYIGGGVTDADCYLDVEIGWYPIDGQANSEWEVLVDDLTPMPLDGFVKLSGTAVVPEDYYRRMELWLEVIAKTAGGADAAEIYATQVMVEKGSVVNAYADGDSTGWVWANGDYKGPSCLNEGGV